MSPTQLGSLVDVIESGALTGTCSFLLCICCLFVVVVLDSSTLSFCCAVPLGKDVLTRMFRGDTRLANEIAAAEVLFHVCLRWCLCMSNACFSRRPQGMIVVQDEAAIRTLCSEVVDANPSEVPCCSQSFHRLLTMNGARRLQSLSRGERTCLPSGL